MTAVASLKQLVCAPRQGQQVERRRDLAITGTVMLDDKGAVKAERLGIDDILDEIAKSLAAAEFGGPPRRRRKGRTALPRFSFQRSIHCRGYASDNFSKSSS
jgi:hypothetical protein